MGCQASIGRWSPFFGICLARSSGAIGWMTNGAQVARSAGPGGACKPCQCACSPSPSVETMPTPVIHTSRAGSAVRSAVSPAAASAMGQLLHREGEGGGGLLHVLAEFRGGELDHAERDLGVAGELAVVADLRLGARKPRAVVHQRRGELQRVAWLHERAQLGLL